MYNPKIRLQKEASSRPPKAGEKILRLDASLRWKTIEFYNKNNEIASLRRLHLVQVTSDIFWKVPAAGFFFWGGGYRGNIEKCEKSAQKNMKNRPRKKME